MCEGYLRDQDTIRSSWIKVELRYPVLDINTELEGNLMSRREDPIIIEPELNASLEKEMIRKPEFDASVQRIS